MKRVLILITAVLLGSCVTDLPEMANENQTNLLKLQLGMPKAAVVQLMGNRTATTPDGPVGNPFRTETFQNTGGTNFEVLYYITERHRRFQPVRLRQATPVVFRDGLLIGWGNDALRQARTAESPRGR